MIKEKSLSDLSKLLSKMEALPEELVIVALLYLAFNLMGFAPILQDKILEVIGCIQKRYITKMGPKYKEVLKV